METNVSENDCLKSPIQPTVKKTEDFQKQLDRIKGRVATLRKEKNENKDRFYGCYGKGMEGPHVASRQDEPPKLARDCKEERVVEDIASLNINETNSDEKSSNQSLRQALQNCPVCSGSLLHNYVPNDASECSICSITLPLQEFISTYMPCPSGGKEQTSQDEEGKKLVQKVDHWYCTNCKAYVIMDDNLLNKRKEQLKGLRREIMELDKQYKLRIDKLEMSHNQQVGEIKFEKQTMETDLCQQLNELTGIKREQEKKIEALFAKVYKGGQLRRKLHNHLQDLRGNIRVFVRTRPFILIDGKQASEISPITVSHDHESLSFFDRSTRSQHDFHFDRVFSSLTEQEGVFEEVSDFVQSALDGYNVCLFAYGQTGSGKTYTMQGVGEGSQRGIIPRALEEILTQAKCIESDKFEYKMKASFLEIYNEKLVDLLTERLDSQADAKLAIKRNKEGRCYVENLTQVEIDFKNPDKGMRQFNCLMSSAMRSRSVAETNMSTHSSRSHAIFILDMEGISKDTGEVLKGSLNLCDLAGSERLHRAGTGSNKTRLRETQAINKSLSALGTVFHALANKAPHVPYRNSKLTFLLQDCLSGDGKALMLVNLSPTERSGGESLCSLRFAQQVNQVSFGKVKRNVEYTK